MDEEIRDWIQKKKKEAEELEKSGGTETIPSSPEKLPAEAQPAEEKTSEPIKTEIQPVEQKTAVKTAQPASPKISETTAPSDHEPEEITEEEEDQYPPSQASDTSKTEYQSKPPLLTKKSKILLVLIAISIPVFLFIYFYLIPKILK